MHVTILTVLILHYPNDGKLINEKDIWFNKKVLLNLSFSALVRNSKRFKSTFSKLVYNQMY